MHSSPTTNAALPSLSWDDAPRESDIASVRGLIHAVGVFSPEEVRIAGELIEERLHYDDTDYAFVFARSQQGKKLAGYACFGEIPMTDNRYDLYWLAVTPSLQGQNVAAELLRRVEQRIRNSGGRILYVETSSREAYAPARRFYLKQGFEECANLPDFYQLGDNKVIYSKRLQPAGSPRMQPLRD